MFLQPHRRRDVHLSVAVLVDVVFTQSFLHLACTCITLAYFVLSARGLTFTALMVRSMSALRSRTFACLSLFAKLLKSKPKNNFCISISKVPFANF
jgi:hypothetical protein